MKKFYAFFLACFACSYANAQSTALAPSVSPSLFQHDDEITVTYDVTDTSLEGLSNAFIWVWLPGASSTIDAKYNVNPASSDATKSNNAKFTKSTVNGRVLFTITFTPSDFFDGDISTQSRIGMLLKGNAWADGQTTDFITDFWDGSFTINLISPVSKPLFVEQGEDVNIQAEVPVDATFQLFVNDVLVNEQSGTLYNYNYTVAGANGSGEVKLVATSGANTEEVNFQYLISGSSPVAAREAGIVPGINYGTDDTKVVVCLWAPGKTSAYVRGDFTEWNVLPEYIMNRDGEFFWLEISNLEPGVEYGFQYLVDEELFLADPYADKILDPDDQYIPESVYPDLKDYPSGALSDRWYFNRVAVIQTNQTPFDWDTENYTRPDEKKLVIYELLIRDFFGANERTYKNLTDTLGYLKKLGVNAIQLMPVMEFNGNESWGYNPAFMFAPDKYYGPKNELKKFVDRCHSEGIAVILDIAMNHQDLPNPYVLLDFDFATGKPNATNKWFNVDAKHPFNVFFDMNHESPYTKSYLDTVNHYWLNEYRIDGFRFDLSKGFTQKNNPDDVNAWSAYDDSRIALLKRMADKIWAHSPDAIVILEHLAVNQEEKELAEYRADEGKGMMLWGNMNHSFTEISMGYGADISGTSFENRSWTVPHLISYMESHDEERLAYKNQQFGKVEGQYSVKDKAVSLQRIKAASVLFYSVPGPKMLWQFGELGYDYSINTCEDGSVKNECRISNKPVKWDYLEDVGRFTLFMHTSDLIKLHTTYPVFTYGDVTISTGNSLVKQVQVKNSPYTDTPATTDQMNVQAVANLDVATLAVAVNFPHTGTWYDYYNGGATVSVASTPLQMTLSPGEFRLFTDVPIGAGPVTGIHDELSSITAHPNPTTGRFIVEGGDSNSLYLSDLRGVPHQTIREGNEIDISHLPAGLYLLHQRGRHGKSKVIKIIKL